MAARKRSAKKAAPNPVEQQRPAAASPPPRDAAAKPHTLSIGKTQRHRNARLCPGGNAVDTFGAKGDGCGRCPSIDECTVARFNPKA